MCPYECKCTHPGGFSGFRLRPCFKWRGLRLSVSCRNDFHGWSSSGKQMSPGILYTNPVSKEAGRLKKKKNILIVRPVRRRGLGHLVLASGSVLISQIFTCISKQKFVRSLAHILEYSYVGMLVFRGSTQKQGIVAGIKFNARIIGNTSC